MTERKKRSASNREYGDKIFMRTNASCTFIVSHMLSIFSLRRLFRLLKLVSVCTYFSFSHLQNSCLTVVIFAKQTKLKNFSFWRRNVQHMFVVSQLNWMDFVDAIRTEQYFNWTLFLFEIWQKSQIHGDWMTNDGIGYKHSNATFPSKLTFFWLMPLLWRGYREPLEIDDLGLLSEKDTCRTHYDRFQFIYRSFGVCTHQNV